MKIEPERSIPSNQKDKLIYIPEISESWQWSLLANIFIAVKLEVAPSDWKHKL